MVGSTKWYYWIEHLWLEHIMRPSHQVSDVTGQNKTFVYFAVFWLSPLWHGVIESFSGLGSWVTGVTSFIFLGGLSAIIMPTGLSLLGYSRYLL